MLKKEGYLLFVSILCAVTLSTAAVEFPIGTNLDGSIGGPQLVMKNQMLGARPWEAMSVDSNWDYPHKHLGRDTKLATALLQLRPDGYPTVVPQNNYKVVSLLMVNLQPEGYCFGKFTVLFEGKGEVWLGWDAGGKALSSFNEGYVIPESGHTVIGNGGTTKFNFEIKNKDNFFGKYYNPSFKDPVMSSGICVHINRSNADDPIRNIRVIIPDKNGGTSYVENYEQQPFNPAFLEEIHPYKYYRFMDWGPTNDSPVKIWSDRKKTGVKGAGFPIETMIDLCNLTNRDMWYCVPHEAFESDFVDSAAILIKKRLKPNLKLYLELSNEIWNGSFYQSISYMKKGRKLFPGTLDTDQANKVQVYASGKVFTKFDKYWGDEKNRIIKVLGGWAAQSALTEKIVSYLLDNRINTSGIKIDAFAIAPYFGNSIAGTATSELVQAELQSAIAKASEHKAKLDKLGYPVKVICYEGGQHVIYPVSNVVEINRDAFMYQTYKTYLSELKRIGISEYCNFVHISRFYADYAWGAREYLGQPLSSAHKYKAIHEHMLSNGQYNVNETRLWEQASSIAPFTLNPSNRILNFEGLRSPSVYDLRGRKLEANSVRLPGTAHGLYISTTNTKSKGLLKLNIAQ